MAQHYQVDIEKEVEVKASLERIGKYIARFDFLKNLKNFERRTIYKKSIYFLPDTYLGEYCKQGSFAIVVKPYDLKRTKKDWGEYWENACLEVHCNVSGNIVGVYYPM